MNEVLAASLLDASTRSLYNGCMAFTLTLRPEIETELKERAEAEHRSVHKTVELAVEEYLRRTAHRAEVLYHAREVIAEDRAFLGELGDR